MSVKSQQCSVTVTITEEEHNFFTETARVLRISRNSLIYRLVCYFTEGKISWEELFKQCNELQFPNEPSCDNKNKKQMRVCLEPEHYTAFSRIVEEWGSTTSVVLMRLLQLYMAGKIGRGDIWQ